MGTEKHPRFVVNRLSPGAVRPVFTLREGVTWRPGICFATKKKVFNLD
jgi:hypothetical protein